MITGKVVSGIGKGKYYIEMYQDYLEKKLGFTSFLGTLNLKVDDINLPQDKKILIIPKEKNWSKVDCYLVTINNKYKGAIIIPHKTEHGKDIIELIATENLRQKLNLENGDEIQCELV
ncbi:MAG: CTP-dependent riboflavin kinase [Nanoarchaeota archaeon]|nr:CTP-dependent riboflavin kinase [Nanoarchaeota archaeon]